MTVGLPKVNIIVIGDTVAPRYMGGIVSKAHAHHKSMDARVCYIKRHSTLGPPSLRVPHSQIQRADCDKKYTGIGEKVKG